MVRKQSINWFLNKVSGVIHIGAHIGQERKQYGRRELKVVWIEPIPSIFKHLQTNIEEYPNQQAYQYLITDKDNETHTLNIASNNGASSSIFELGSEFAENHPTISYTRSITLQSTTLPTMLKREGINTKGYNALVIDTQGAELLVLKGALPILHQFKYIRAEATDYDLYDGCCQIKELNRFLKAQKFGEVDRYTCENSHEFDIVYKRRE